MFDIVSFGEVLIDFTPSGLSQAGNELFEKNPGGAPANVAASVKKLGKKSAFIGMVGKDHFGIFLKDVLKKIGVDVSGLKFSEEVTTTLAFVHIDSNGQRFFSFYRNPGADMMISEKDLDFKLIKNAKLFHFGSISLTHEPARSATLSAVITAKENGSIISYDPNLRPRLWSNLDDAKEKIMMGLKFCHILKVSEEELEFITGCKSLEEGSKIIFDMGVKVVFVTLGPKGCFYRYAGGHGRRDTYDTKIVDTTGAGDGFFGGVLFKLCEFKLTEINKIPKDSFENIVDFGNAVGSLAATKKGAIPAMPSIEEVEACRGKTARLTQ